MNLYFFLAYLPLHKIKELRVSQYDTFLLSYSTLMLTVVFLGIGFVMKVESLEQQIAKQEERLKQLKAQKQAVLAREKKKATDQQRKEDTRRKILLGSLALKKMQDDSEKAKIIADLNDYLKEDRDRLLFDLQSISKGS